MATLTKGHTFASGDTVTATKLNDLVDSATIAFVAADDTDNSTLEASGGKLRVKDAGVTDAKLATGAVTGAAGGGKLAASAITGQTQKTSIADADELLVHSDSDSALRRVAWSAMQPNGTVLQTLQNTNSSYVSITSTIAKNDTAPTSTSGTEILSQAITPSLSSNKVLVRFSAWVTVSTAIYPVGIICRGSTVIQAVGHYESTNARTLFTAEFLDSPNTTSSTTYSVRLGPNTGTLYLNGSASSREYGGTSSATLTVQEIKA